MPLGFKGNILTTSSASAQESIVTANGRSSGSNYSGGVYPSSFTEVKDELNIFGTPTTDGTANASARYMPIANGTYAVEITAIGGIPQSNASGPWSGSFQMGAGKIHSSAGSITPSFIYSVAPNVQKATSGADETMESVTLPYSLGNITFSTSTNTKGVFYRWAAPYGGHQTSSVPVTFRFTAT